MTVEFLTDDELFELTCYKRRAEQCRELQHQGIPFRRNRLGRPLVRRAVLDEVFGTRPAKPVPKINLVALKEVSHGKKA